MDINSLTASNVSYGICIGGQLSEEIKRKLRALGVEPSTVSSETQAKALVEKLEAKLQQVHKAGNPTSAQKICTGGSEVISRAKVLANQVGVDVSASDSLSDIFSKIASKINKIPDGGGDKNKNSLKAELSQLESDYSSIKSSQDSMFSAMSQTANLNKYFLGL